MHENLFKLFKHEPCVCFFFFIIVLFTDFGNAVLNRLNVVENCLFHLYQIQVEYTALLQLSSLTISIWKAFEDSRHHL